MDGRVTRLAPDVLPAAALLVLGEVEVALGDPSAPRWAIALLTVALTAPLALRRRAPLAVLIVTVVAMSALSAVDDSFSQAAVPLAIGVAVYSAGRHADATGAWFALALLLATFGAGALIAGQSANDFAIGALMFGGLWAFGRGLRARSERVDALTERAERLERERAEGERAAVAAERARIARELHDIVSHSISVVVVQTRAVRRRLDPGQERERDDLAGVETTARQAMGEMRRLFGVLRADGSEPSLAPQPGLDQLARLVEETRHAGVPVEVAVSGDAEALSPGVDLAAYRIVQEALTNVRKHAGEAQAHAARGRRPAAAGPGTVERGDRRRARAGDGHGQEPRQRHPHEARPARPRAGGDIRLRERAGPARRRHSSLRIRRFRCWNSSSVRTPLPFSAARLEAGDRVVVPATDAPTRAGWESSRPVGSRG